MKYEYRKTKLPHKSFLFSTLSGYAPSHCLSGLTAGLQLPHSLSMLMR